MSELTFKRDTEFRKQFFVPNSFAHPAKMDAQLLIWLVEHYTEPGQTILDPMFGSGTTMLACTLGRHVIGVELEQKFVDMAKQNWEKVQQRPQLGYAMGDCQILLGDARNLPQVLCNAIITSPPFQEVETQRKGQEESRKNYNYGHKLKMSSEHPDNISRLAERNYGDINVVISSPPYADSETVNKRIPEGYFDQIGGIRHLNKATVSELNISNLPYGRIDAILTSPPYAETVASSRKGSETAKQHDLVSDVYGEKPPYDGKWKPEDVARRTRNRNIGHINILKNDGTINLGSYLEAMLTVYQNCYTVLREGGLLILVVKNFVRQMKEVDLRADTVKLAERAGFTFIEEHYRKLTQQSFWRILYKRKYPEGPVIDKEYVLAFRKVLL